MMEAEPEIKRGKNISPIWILPIVALGLGVWMVVMTLMTEGPTIEIILDNARGLEAGKTTIKYRDVTVGLVEEVVLSNDLKRVVVRAQLEKQVAGMLRDETRFWVVTARIGAGSISGLDTVLSGGYIEMAPGGGASRRTFEALRAPPLTPAGTEGLRLSLSSDRAASVSTGDPVLYRGFKVGRIETSALDYETRRMNYQVFIDAPFHTLVNSSSRFWDVSGISLSAGADGVSFEMASVTTLLAGGISFATPPGMPAGQEVEHGTEFQLYRNREEILTDPFRHGMFYVVGFKQSLRGLNPGAPVEYRGIRIGKVERIMLHETVTAIGPQMGSGQPLRVMLYLEPGRLEMPDSEESVALLAQGLESSVLQGLRATLASGNLITGGKFISLDFFEDVEPASVGDFAGVPTLPTQSSGLERVEQKLFALLDKLNDLPLEGTVENATGALAELSLTLESLRKSLNPQMVAQLAAGLEKSLADLNRVLEGLSPESQLYQNLNTNLAGLDRTLKNLEELTATLAESPNALVVGSQLPADPTPEARK